MNTVTLQGPWNELTGRLGLLLELHYNNPVIMSAFVFAVGGAILVLAALTLTHRWGWLWREWLTTVDHKKIGVMYIIVGLVMLFRGFIDGLMIRTQQAMAVGANAPGYFGAVHGYMPPFHLDQVFTAHGTIMILMAVTPILVGFMNIIVPLQIGARDMAYPFLNAVGLWLTTVAAALLMIALFVGNFSHAGWVGLAPLTELSNSPGVGVDYWIWAIQIGSVGTTLGAVNLIATIIKMRAPGMSWGRMPVFTWTALATNTIALTAFPVLTVALGMLTLDRYLSTHFFTADLGGNLMMYTNLFWIWGHPEVYFVVLPAFGFLSEIIPTFSEKPLFGYITMVIATMAIAGVSWSVWLHHFFTMGAAPDINVYYSIATMLVGIPTGVKVFNWAFTLYRGRVRFDVPMMWAVGSVIMLITGGLTGMMLAIPAINYIVHNSVFVVAHFHNMFMVIVYASFAAVTYWFPKIFGIKLDERYGRAFFWLFTAGTVLVFIPMYTLGLMGMTRRLDVIAHPSWAPLLDIQMVGIGAYVASVLTFLGMLAMSVRNPARTATRERDPWRTSRSLEWLTHTPVPAYNFAVVPVVHGLDELAWRRAQGVDDQEPTHYEPIVMPRYTAIPIVIGAASLAFSFAMIWRVPWLAIAGLAVVLVALIVRAFDTDTEYTLSADDIERMERGARAGKAQSADPARPQHLPHRPSEAGA